MYMPLGSITATFWRRTQIEAARAYVYGVFVLNLCYQKIMHIHFASRTRFPHTHMSGGVTTVHAAARLCGVYFLPGRRDRFDKHSALSRDESSEYF